MYKVTPLDVFEKKATFVCLLPVNFVNMNQIWWLESDGFNNTIDKHTTYRLIST